MVIAKLMGGGIDDTCADHRFGFPPISRGRAHQMAVKLQQLGGLFVPVAFRC